MSVFAEGWGRIRRTWAGLSPGQRTAGILLVAAMGVALAWASLWGGRSAMVPLFPRALENPSEIGAVLKSLKSAGIDARQERGQILVPEDSRDRAFVELSGKSAWPQDQTTVEMKSIGDDWKLSDPARRERARLLLQGRLARMIGMMAGVGSAGVVLAEGNDTPFAAERFEPKATVQVVLAPGVPALTGEVADTIRRMVAFGVQGVKPSAVAVVDNLGRIYEERADRLEPGASDLERLRRAREEEIVRKVHNELAPIAGPRIAVTASVVLGQDRVREESTRVNPDESAVTRRRSETRSAPQGATEEKEEIERLASTTRTETVKGAGEIRQVTVGLLIPFVQGTAEPEAGLLAKYRDFAMKAAGITDPRFVTVAAVPYVPAALPEARPWRPVLDPLLEHADRILFGLLALGALLVLGLALRRAARIPPAPAFAPARPGGATEVEARVRELVRQDPHAAADLLKRWMEG